jgi:hypothetical protein
MAHHNRIILQTPNLTRFRGQYIRKFNAAPT